MTEVIDEVAPRDATAPVRLGTPAVAAPYARIVSIGGYRPGNQVSNDDLARSLDTSDQWISQRTGIRRRRFAASHETVVEMGAAAASQALERAGEPARSVECVVVATMSFTGQTPSAAVQIAHRIGAGKPVAFDLSAACAGFPYALDVARGLMASGSVRTALVIGAERMTDIVDPGDRTTAVLFSDGAGAALLRACHRPEIGPAAWGSDGALAHTLGQQGEWARYRDEPGLRPPYLRMKGPELYRWATQDMPQVARRALASAGLDVADLAAFIPHQANLRMIDAIARALRLPEHVAVARDVCEQGNTSAASIPLAMDRLLAARPELSGRPALLLGFGAGVAYGAQVILLP